MRQRKLMARKRLGNFAWGAESGKYLTQERAISTVVSMARLLQARTRGKRVALQAASRTVCAVRLSTFGNDPCRRVCPQVLVLVPKCPVILMNDVTSHESNIPSIVSLTRPYSA